MIDTEFTGSKRVTCKEGIKLLVSGKLRKAWFRPDKILSPINADDDDCYVWYLNEKENEKEK